MCDSVNVHKCVRVFDNTSAPQRRRCVGTPVLEAKCAVFAKLIFLSGDGKLLATVSLFVIYIISLLYFIVVTMMRSRWSSG